MSALNTVPLLACAVACALGIAGAASGWGPLPVWIGLLVLGMLVAIGGLVWNRYRLVSLGPLVHTIALLVVVSAAGGLRYIAWETPSPQSLQTLPDSLFSDALPVHVVGTVHGPVITHDGTTRFELQADRLLTATDTLRIHDRIQVRWRSSPWDEDPPPFPDVVAGDRWAMTGPLRAPPAPRNPADFDYGAYLHNHGIHWTLAVDTPAHVERVASAPPGYARSVHHARSYVMRTLHAHVHTEAARSIQTALLLGDRSAVDDAHRTAFASTGLMHLLAVSGLHVLLVGMLVYHLLRSLLMRLGWSRRRVNAVRAALTLLLLLTYMALTGARPSVVRATLMAALLIGGTLTQRVYASLNALGAAALILLWMRPTALYDPGFQLSFAAVTSIVLFNPKFMSLCPGILTHGSVRRFLTQSVTVSAAALLGTTPFLLLHFGFVSGAGLLLNIIAIPLTALALASGILTVATSALPGVASLFGAAADLLTQCLLATAYGGAMVFDGWQWAVPHVSGWVVLFLSVVLLVFGGMRQWQPRHGGWAALTSVLLVVWIPLTARPLAPTLDILFFDVGQSDAALIRTPDGRHLLVDAGLRTPHANAAEYTIMPHLRYAGIDALDAVLITHPDADHLGGLPTLLEAGVVNAVWDNGETSNRPLYDETIRWIEDRQTSHRTVRESDTLHIGDHTRVVGLGPPSSASSSDVQTSNDRSVVAALQYGSMQILFSGDVEARAEHWLTQTYGSALRSDVVTVPHHGSPTSSSMAFVNAVAHENTHAVISAGRYNQFGFPDSTVVSRWESHAKAVHQTSTGAVWLRTDGDSVWVVPWQ